MKSSSKIKLLYFLPDRGGCSYYRSILPFEVMEKQSDKFTTMFIDQATKKEEMEKYMNMADIFMMQRFDQIEMVRRLKKLLNAPIVIDYDDNFDFISPYSNHYKDYGLSDKIEIKLSNGDVVRPWIDGDTIDLKLNKKHMHRTRS